MPRRNKKPRMTSTTIEKIVFGGQGMGFVPKSDDPNPQVWPQQKATVFSWNALPGEQVEIQLTKRKKEWAEGIATNITDPSPNRIIPNEDHYLSCSPWQMLSWEQELKWKVDMARETYEKIGQLDPSLLDELEIISDDQQYGYRNKMEYSFAEDEDGRMSLAFFQRGTKYRYPIHDCQLAEPALNQSAHSILDWINEVRIPLRSLKSLILRSNGAGDVIAALFIKDELTLPNHPQLGPLSLWSTSDRALSSNQLSSHSGTNEVSDRIPSQSSLLGFHIYYSTHKTPASRPDKMLYSSGQDYLTIDIYGVQLKFGLLSFFQVNLPVFQLALDDISHLIEPHSQIVDFYSGVGAISLPLRNKLSDCTLVDNNTEAIQYAEENIKLNSLQNFKTVLSDSEHITDLINSDQTIIFDPPRVGLHRDVVEKVLEALPPRIIYMSCNVSTQARDLALLQAKYKIKFLKLYNFFPRTPHIEALCVLERCFA